MTKASSSNANEPMRNLFAALAREDEGDVSDRGTLVPFQGQENASTATIVITTDTPSSSSPTSREGGRREIKIVMRKRGVRGLV